MTPGHCHAGSLVMPNSGVISVVSSNRSILLVKLLNVLDEVFSQSEITSKEKPTFFVNLYDLVFSIDL